MFHHVSPRFTPWELRQTPPVGWRRRPWRVARISRCSATQRRPLRPGSPWPRRRTATKMEGEQLWFHMGRRHGNHMGWVKTYYYHIGGINLLLTSYFKVPMVPGFWGIATWKTLSKRWAKYEKTWKIWQKMVTTWNGLLFCFKKKLRMTWSRSLRLKFHHGRAAVSSQGVFQQSGQLGIPIGYVRSCSSFGQGRNHITLVLRQGNC